MNLADKADKALARFLERVGIKLLLIILASIFLCVQKLDQSNWVMVVLTIAGFRTFNQAVSIYKGRQDPDAEPKEPKDENV